LQHFCFEVTNLTDFRAKLERAGLKMTPISTGMSKAIQSWTNDPDGNPIELMEYTPEALHVQP
jgi:hypothetical protein